MLNDPRFAYEQIGRKFGLTKQRIAKLAEELGINGRQRQHERTLRHGPYVITEEYPPSVRAVIGKIRRHTEGP
jgi:predicted transcriptional regulator